MKSSGFEPEHEEEEEEGSSAPENTVNSPLSGPHKKRKVAPNKTVVTMPINGGGGGRGEVYPPPDKWSWRKYGQKPIKGSPYPRGYYRCSSSKGCPARKQVERSQLDPTTLLITYTSNHNHPRPSSSAKNNHHHHHHHHHRGHPSNPPSGLAMKPAPPSPNKECAAFSAHLDIEPAFSELAGELGWLCNVESTVMDGTTLVGPVHWACRELEVFMPIGEEDKLLFGDLGDLPESSMVFPQVVTPCCGGTL